MKAGWDWGFGSPLASSLSGYGGSAWPYVLLSSSGQSWPTHCWLPLHSLLTLLPPNQGPVKAHGCLSWLRSFLPQRSRHKVRRRGGKEERERERWSFPRIQWFAGIQPLLKAVADQVLTECSFWPMYIFSHSFCSNKGGTSQGEKNQLYQWRREDWFSRIYLHCTQNQLAPRLQGATFHGKMYTSDSTEQGLTCYFSHWHASSSRASICPQVPNS